MKYLIFLLNLFLVNNLAGQDRSDNNWVFARGSKGVLLSFEGDTLHVSVIPQMDMRTVEANSTISDSIGNLLFYSNNCFVANAIHQDVENGDGLNPGLMQDQWCATSGDPISQSIISFPQPGKPSLFYVFHVDLEMFNFGLPGGSDFAPMNLYYSLIDINENNGLGKVINKNIKILQDTLSRGALHGVRHANGRDWWILCPEYKSNCYYTILLDPTGAQLMDKQCLGHFWDANDLTGQTLFTPEGEKYVRCNADNGLNIFDFDRCTGKLSNPIHISLLPDTNRISGMALSANSRFAYVTFTDKIYQFDLWSSNIAESKVLVSENDGMISNGNLTDFYHAKLAPDRKIYICTYGPTYYLHVINNPDSLGIACEVLQHEILLPITHFASMPNTPNFRLGPNDGPCDTLTTSIKQPLSLFSKQGVHLSPNPVSEIVEIRLEESPERSQIQVFNIFGELVNQAEIPKGTSVVNMSVSGWPAGTYFIQVERFSIGRWLGKLIVTSSGK